MKPQKKYFLEDYIGKQIWDLTPKREVEELAKDGSKQWEFECICGKKIIALPYRVICGHNKSCGCKRYRSITTDNVGFISTKNLSDEEKRFYKKWQTIRTRCYNKNHEKYSIYGEKGIFMCNEWVNDARAFIDWCKETHPGDFSLTIDRIDSTGPYSPDNCRWATIKQQNRNRKCSVWIDFDGEHILLAELAERYSQDLEVLRSRLKIGWTLEKALTTPIRKSKKNLEI